MRQGLLILLLTAVVGGRQGSSDVLMNQEPASLQEKTIKAIENLSHVLSDLKESMKKEENAATPTQPAPGANKVEILEDTLSKLTVALHKNTKALQGAHRGHIINGGAAGCELPYWRLGDECFYVNRRLRVSWSEARQFCQGIEGDLAQPRVVAKLRAALLVKYPEDYHSFFWVGASEAGGTEGNWKWLSGVRVNSGGWARDQPDGGNENCVVLSQDEHPSLHDSPCYTHTTFICQTTNTTATQTPA